MRPKSNTLFHFTKNRETLKLILKDGFWPRYCLEDVSWLAYDTYDYVGYPMVCFCDIPLSRISEHVGFYGEFGVGLTREWAELNGLNPVLYVAGENAVSSTFKELGGHAMKTPTDADKEAARTSIRYLLAHTKPVSGSMVVDGKPVSKLFYQESEWRYVPKHPETRDHLSRSEFEHPDQISYANDLTKEHCMIKFGPRDIRYIFVKTDADIPDIVNFIQAELDMYPGVDQKILMSRIVSLEGLSQDV